MTNRRSLLLLGIAALLPLIVLALGLSVVSLRQQQGAMEQAARERTDRIAALVERELDAQIEILRTLAQSPLLDDPVDLTRATNLLARVRQDRPLWRAISVSDNNGMRLVDVPDPIGGVARSRVLEPESHAHVVRTQTPAIGPMRRGNRNRPAFAVRVPVLRGEPAETRLVLSAVVEPSNLRDLLFTAGLPEGWLGAMVDGEGNIAARSMGPSTLIGQPASESARAARARGGSGVYEGVSLEGVPNFTAYKVLPAFNWSVHIAVLLNIYQAPVTRSLWLTTAGGALALALAFLFSGLLWRELTARQKSQRAADEVHRLEALGRMTGGVAHDFNNLLMIVQGSAEALKRRRDAPERIATLADNIIAAALRGQSITRQLLAFARKSPYEPVVFSLRERRDELLPLLQRSTRENIHTTLEVPPDIWPIHADPNALEVALINLAVNARDAMPEGGRLLVQAENVSLSRDQAGGAGLSGNFVRIQVTDTGTGIPADSLSRIFEPFYTTKDPSKGTGLGLSQVHGFAQQSGGALRVESELGRGTTFSLYLPRAAQMSGPAAKPTTLHNRIEGDRVLLVEDNLDVARVTMGMLEALGYQVTAVESASAALAALDKQETAADVVLSDIVLGVGASGLDLAVQLRERRPDLPVVLMTGYSEALAKGDHPGLKVLNKPFGEADLASALASVRDPGLARVNPSNVVRLTRCPSPVGLTGGGCGA